MKKKLGAVLLIFALLVSFAVMPVAAAPPALITNGSFETGDYTGWTLLEDSGNPHIGTWGIASNGQVINTGNQTFDFCDNVSVTQTSPGLPLTYTATDGNRLAYQLQTGPERHRMFQDVALSPCATTLTWDMQYDNHALSFSPAQFLAVHIRNLSDNILQTLFITTQFVDPQSIPIMTSFSANISAYAGSTVRLDIEMNVNLGSFDAAFDNFAITPAVCELEVDIDIKPGSDPNSINPKSKGVIPVAILTTADFDASTVDGETARFGPDGALPVRYAIEDVNNDGDDDMILHFKTQDTGIAAGDTEATLTAKTTDGTDIVGTDSVRTEPPKGKK